LALIGGWIVWWRDFVLEWQDHRSGLQPAAIDFNILAYDRITIEDGSGWQVSA
jgi:hypothetical protein